MSKMSATCQLKERFLKDTCPMTRVCEFFRKSHEWLSSGLRVSRFLLFGFVGIPEAQSYEVTVEGFPLRLGKLQKFGDH
jgi:hypothetical protein